MASRSVAPSRWSGGPRNLRRIAGVAVLVDIVFCAAVWTGAELLQPPAATAPVAPGVPIVVFYSSEPKECEKRITKTVTAVGSYGPRPVLSVGGSRPRREYFGAEVFAAEIAQRGIPSHLIRSERSSYDTWTNVTAARQLAGDVPAMIMVGDPLQLVRVCRFLRFAAPATACFGASSGLPGTAQDLWLRPHYEAAAWLSLLLPERLRLGLVRLVRA